ncbi:3-ketoacyl-ACP reductase [Anoxynatronum sibiricum]|uniref:3-ketoacyl-ACP reductase n=1 Tax=Anoxynatronum sibiricum TaxID=210623 RepID=A0ABU9VVF3_9CLOT
MAVVTGGTRGIGFGIVKELYADGYQVACLGRTLNETAAQLVASSQGNVRFVASDLGSTEKIQASLDEVMAVFGRIDVLVNNAGVAPKERLDLLETTPESFDFVVNTNLKGTFFMTQKAANLMLQQQDRPVPPKIINIASLSSYTSSVNRGEYCISKAGISMVTTLFADRLAEQGILVYEIRPGIIKTDMTAKVSEKYDRLINDGLLPIRRWGTPEDIAAAASLLCSPKMTYSTGDVINVDGGFHLRRL